MSNVTIAQLLPGDNLLCWMRLGLALFLVRYPRGTIYYEVPSRPQRATADALPSFGGYVVQNNVSDTVLTVHVVQLDSWRSPTKRPSAVASISYSAFQRIRRLSKEVVEPLREEDVFRPTSKAGFGGTAFRPFRTVEEVAL